MFLCSKSLFFPRKCHQKKKESGSSITKLTHLRDLMKLTLTPWFLMILTWLKIIIGKYITALVDQNKVEPGVLECPKKSTLTTSHLPTPPHHRCKTKTKNMPDSSKTPEACTSWAVSGSTGWKCLSSTPLELGGPALFLVNFLDLFFHAHRLSQSPGRLCQLYLSSSVTSLRH